MTRLGLRKPRQFWKRTGAEGVSSTEEAGADFAKSDRPVARKQTLWLSLENRIFKDFPMWLNRAEPGWKR
jgi:hypothetical protein